MDSKETLMEEVQRARVYNDRQVIFFNGTLETVVEWLGEELGKEPVEYEDFFVSDVFVDEEGENRRQISCGEESGINFIITIPA